MHEWGLPGAAIAAHRAGVPGIWHGYGRMIPDGIGLELPTTIAEVPRRPHVDIWPPSLQDKDFLATQERIELRPVPFAGPDDRPAWTGHRGSRSLIYLTLGTAFGTPEVLTTAVEGLAWLDATVVVAAGRVPLDQLRHLPGNVIVQQWVAQADLLPLVDAVVHHGGSGTSLGALTVGVPQLILPQGADQFANADALVAAGAAVQLRPADVSALSVAEQMRRLAGDAGYRDAALTIADEIARTPAPDEVARTLPDYARRGPE